jgi:hypothetical protein
MGFGSPLDLYTSLSRSLSAIVEPSQVLHSFDDSMEILSAFITRPGLPFVMAENSERVIFHPSTVDSNSIVMDRENPLFLGRIKLSKCDLHNGPSQ